jgi:hypothetical protein
MTAGALLTLYGAFGEAPWILGKLPSAAEPFSAWSYVGIRGPRNYASTASHSTTGS